MWDLGRTMLASVEREPDALAIVDGDLRLTYRQWFERMARVVGAFDRFGLRRGDRLLMVLQNRWEMATLHWACQLAGVVASPVNWRVKSEELDYYVMNAGAAAVAFEPVSEATVAGSREAGRLRRIGVGAAGGATVAFEELYREVAASELPRARAEDLSLMFYTSGTTGQPKGVPRTHAAERAAALAHVAQNCYRFGERTLGVMPLYHTMGVRSLLAMALLNGVFICVARFEPAPALELIARERVTNLYLVPTLYHDLLAYEGFSRADVSSVRKVGFAGAPMTDALVQRVAQAFKPELFVNHYGSTEIYTFTVNQQAAEKPGSAGKAGINQRVRVVRIGPADPEAVVAAGQEGEIIADLSGEESFAAYWQRPEADARAIRGNWYFTGDTGHFDADGDLFVTGRVDDMIITGGENVMPVEVESVLSLHPAVDEVAVAGLPDERWGQRVTAFVKPRAPVDAQALDEHCRNSRLANFKRPREYVFVKAVPKSPVGKILRRLLVSGDYERLAQPGNRRQSS